MDTERRLESDNGHRFKVQDRPLCRGYRIVVVTESHADVHFDDGTLELSLGWALGCLPNTEAEVLGLWVQPAASGNVIRDLRERGAERIAMVIDAGWPSAAAEMLSAYPRAQRAPSTEHFVRRATEPLKRRLRAAAAADLRAAISGGGEAALLGAIQSVLPATDQASRLGEAQQLRKSLAELSEQDRRFVLAADRTATVLLEELARAVQRNGYFLNQDAALEFVAKALLGAERRMDRERAAMAAQAGTLRAASQRCLAVSRAV
ncbi:transposase [Roseateles sp. LYH14W]|uniref:Transposase n=1 Tax=Pelomonas parva TaxID=3299032 RepID=A0ABW7F6I6_9BURK